MCGSPDAMVASGLQFLAAAVASWGTLWWALRASVARLGTGGGGLALVGVGYRAKPARGAAFWMRACSEVKVPEVVACKPGIP